jgi:uncharacterized protein YsxB (DUF464 family)
LTVLVRRSAGRIVAITVSGHAGFAPYGRDVVCAATSALVLSAAHGVSTHCKAPVRIVDDGSADYRLDVPKGGNARAQAVLESAISGLRAIAKSYPGSLKVRTVAGKRHAPPKRSRPTRAARK